jgi:hypothetical protein
MPMDAFENRMQTLAERVKAQPRAEGFEEILMPGEPEDRNEQERRAQGIPLTPDVALTLKAEGERVGVPFRPLPVCNVLLRDMFQCLVFPYLIDFDDRVLMFWHDV